MAKQHGRLGKVALSSDGTTYTDINGITDATLNLEQAAVTTTSHDDGAWESYIAGRKSATIDVSLRWDEADAAQDSLRASYFNGTTLYYRFRLDEVTGLDQYVAQGFVTSMAPSAPNDDPAGFDVTIQLSGAITKSAQP